MRAKMLQRHPSAFLLAAQLISLVLYPTMVNNHNGRIAFGAVGVVVLALALWVVNRSPAESWIAWLFAIPAIGFTAGSIVTGHTELLVWSSMFEAGLYFYAAGSLISYMLHDHQVTSDELFAAGATFTLIAWGFAYAYFVCQAWYPDSFTGLVNPQAPRSWMELLFLSFTTLSGVGIGDILPISAPARALVMLEQFVGVGYIAALVSRLIGLTVIGSRKP